MIELSRREILVSTAAAAALAGGVSTIAMAQTAASAAAWDLTDLYPSDAAWETERQALLKAMPSLKAQKGTLGRSAASMRAAFETQSDINKRASRLYTYASLKADEDRRVAPNQERKQQAQDVFTALGEATAWTNPEVVAIGAAIQGGVLKGEIKDVVLLDVTPLSLGIEMHGGVFEKLIERNSTIPTKNTKVFTTVADNQSVVEIHVLQGEREIAKDNKSLGRFELVGIPAAPRGVPQIEVTFAIDSNGIVSVSARDLATGKAQGLQINPAGGLSQNEIDKIIKDASAFAEADHERREIAAIKNRLEGMIASNERVLSEFGAALGDDERQRIEETLRRCREIAGGESREAFNEAIFDMQGVSKVLTRVMLQRAGAGGAAAS